MPEFCAQNDNDMVLSSNLPGPLNR